MPIGNKKDKKCYTCRYWTGSSVRVTGVNFVEYNQSERATCNKTGNCRSAWTSCKDHERRFDF